MKIYPGMPLVNTATSASTDKIKTKLSPRTQQPNSCWPPPLKPRAYLKPFIEFLRIYSSKAKKVKVFHTFYSLFTGSSPASKSIGHQHIHLLGWSHGWWLLLLLTEQGYILLPWNWSKVDRYYTFVLIWPRELHLKYLFIETAYNSSFLPPIIRPSLAALVRSAGWRAGGCPWLKLITVSTLSVTTESSLSSQGARSPLGADLMQLPGASSVGGVQ